MKRSIHPAIAAAIAMMPMGSVPLSRYEGLNFGRGPVRIPGSQQQPTSMRKHLRNHNRRYTHVMTAMVTDKNLARIAANKAKER